MEKTLLIYYVIIINFLGLLLMGIDKRKAVKNHWRIPERTLFVVSLLGGSIGSFVGMYLFRHKTKHLRFTIGIPVILVLQILAVLFLSLYQKEQMESPSTAVSNELALIQELDEDTIRSFVSYENMMNTPSASSQIGPETTEAVNLFFKNFQYHLHSEDNIIFTLKMSLMTPPLSQQKLLTLIPKPLPPICVGPSLPAISAFLPNRRPRKH